MKFCWNNRTNLSLLVAQSLRIWWKRKWILRHLWHLWFLLWLACVSDQCHTKRKARLWCNRKHDGPCATYTDEVWRFWKFFFSTMPTRQTFIQLLPSTPDRALRFSLHRRGRYDVKFHVNLWSDDVKVAGDSKSRERNFWARLSYFQKLFTPEFLWAEMRKYRFS